MFIPTKKLKNGFEMPVLGIGTARLSSSKKSLARLKIDYMEKEDIERLDKEFPNQQDISDRFPLP